jgi:hypothetical protein
MKRRVSICAWIALAACGGDKSDDSAKPADKPSGGGSATAMRPPDPPRPPPPSSGSGSGSAVASSGSGAGSDHAGAGSGSGSASSFDFDKLSRDDKVAFMKEKVVPAMKKAFQDYDAKKYANFGCKTCHGKDPLKTKYKMPNPTLPKLDFAAMRAGKGDPKVLAFMKDTVMPQMAELLQQPVHSPANPNGFGCLECHVEKK